MGIFNEDEENKKPVMSTDELGNFLKSNPVPPPAAPVGIADQYANLAKEQDAGIQKAQEGADSGNMIANILKGLSGVANADTISRGGKGYDVSNFDRVVDANNARVKAAQAGKESALGDLKNKFNLNNMDLDRKRGDERFAREQTINSREDATYNSAQEKAKREGDPNSQESMLARKMIAEMGFKDNVEGMSAAQLNERFPTFEKLYRINQDKLNRQDALNAAAQARKDALDLKREALDVRKNQGVEAGVIELDKQFAKDYNDWSSGGNVRVETNLQRLRDARADLLKAKDDFFSVSGRYDALMPDALRGEKSLMIQKNVQGPAFAALKEILGGQFTEQEGKKIAADAYDPRLPPEENLNKIDRAIAELEAKTKDKSRKAQYFEQNRSLRGYKTDDQPVAPDQEALDWANANPNDPRAQEILKLHK